MARSDILAGKAHVELYVKNSRFNKALDNARQKMHDMGAGMVSVGAKVAAVGTGIVASLTGASMAFASAGDNLDKMSARTGVAADKLSALEFAAGQSGASIDNVASSIQKMNRRFGRVTAGEGSQSQIDALDKLGLSVEELEKMSPEQRFMAMADAIEGYGDQAAAAGLAQKVMGAGVDKLLPMFANGSAGIRELMDEAEELGVTMSKEDTEAAASLTDAFGRMTGTLKGLTMQIGAAVAPAVEKVANTLAKVTSRVVHFVKENRRLVQIVGMVGVGIAAVGAAIIAAGAAFMGASLAIGAVMSVMSGVATVIGVVVSAIGLIFSPIGLVVAALVAAGYAFFRFSETGQNAVRTMTDKITAIIGSLKETFTAAFQGIRDAIGAGDWKLAGQIAVTALKVVFAQGMSAIATMIGGTMGDTIGKITTLITNGDLSGAWETVALGMEKVWTHFTQGLVDSIAGAVKAAIAMWDGMVKSIVEKASRGGTFGAAFTAITGVNVQDELNNENLQRQSRELERAQIQTALPDAKQALKIAIETGDTKAIEEARSHLEYLEAALKNINEFDPGSVVEGIAQSFQAPESVSSFLDDVQEGSQEVRSEADEAFAENITGGAEEATDRVAELQQELRDLQEQAAKKRAAADAQPFGMMKLPDEDGDGDGIEGPAKLGKASMATFSAQAAIAQGQGVSNEPVVRKMDEVKKEIKEGNSINTLVVDALEGMQLNFG